MMTSKLSCILHVTGKCSEKVKAFDQVTWTKVKTCDSARRKLFRDSRYFAIGLPDNPSDTDGYHSQCYRNVTAIRQTERDDVHTEPSTSGPPGHVLRSEFEHVSVSSTGIFPRLCLFCNCSEKSAGKNKPTEKLGSCEVLERAESMKHAAQILCDAKLLTRKTGIDLVAKEVKYHHSCRKAYLQRAQRCTSEALNEKSQAHESAFIELKSYIQQALIDNEGAELLTSLHKRYICQAWDQVNRHTLHSHSLRR